MLAYGQIASMFGDSFQTSSTHDVERARTYYLKALAIGRELAEADPVNRIAKYDVGSAELRLGALDPPPGQAGESLALLKHAAAIFGDLVNADPQNIRYQRPLALAHEYIGNSMRDSSNPAEALLEYRKSLAGATKILSVVSDDIPSISQALAAEQAIAGVLAAGGDSAGAIAFARQSVARAEASSRVSDNPTRKIHLARAYWAMASVHRRLGDWPQVQIAASRAVAEWRNFIAGRRQSPYASDLIRAEQLVAECDVHLK
jgi:tetratricopeptide (TPR) repeat protein